jgi:hypothetical protein
MTALPSELPPGWLTQIEKTVKGGKAMLLITTILGSSLISAAVTAGLDYYILGPRRLQLTSQHRLKDDQIDAHQKLAEQLNVFNKSLDDAVVTCRLALKNPGEKELQKYATQGLFSLSSQPMIALRAANNNHKIDQAISANLEKTIDTVGKALEKAKTTPNAFKDVIDKYDRAVKIELENHLKSIRQKIDELARS